jgi:hypothetical protein
LRSNPVIAVTANNNDHINLYGFSDDKQCLETDQVTHQKLVAAIQKKNYITAKSDSRSKRERKTIFTSQFEPDSAEDEANNTRVNQKMRELLCSTNCAGDQSLCKEDDDDGKEGECIYDVIKEMEKHGKNVKKAEARKKFKELTQDQKLRIFVRVDCSLLQKTYFQTKKIAVCGAILDPQITFSFFNCAELSDEIKVEIKDVLQ